LKPLGSVLQLEPPAPLESTWEIRFGIQNMLRVLYGVDLELRAVTILGIGIKIVKLCRLMRFGRKLNVAKPRKSRVNEFGAARLHPSIILAATHEKKT
jgi:hypothetical protein